MIVSFHVIRHTIMDTQLCTSPLRRPLKKVAFYFCFYALRNLISAQIGTTVINLVLLCIYQLALRPFHSLLMVCGQLMMVSLPLAGPKTHLACSSETTFPLILTL